MKRIVFRRFTAFFIATLLCVSCVCVCAEEGSWLCPECAASNTGNFCTQCGAQKPEAVVCPGCGEQYPIDTGDMFCGKCGTRLQQAAAPAARLEGNGFDTPEEAVTCYLEGLKKQDYSLILSAFAWETQAEHFSIEAKLRRMEAYNVSARPRMPADSDFMRSALLYSILSQQTDLIYQSLEYYILQDDHPFSTGNATIILKSDEEYDAFMEKFSSGRPEKLAGMTNILFLTPDQVTDHKFSMERNQENYIKMNAMYGADETADVPAIAAAGDEILFCCPTVARYGDKWYMVSVSSMTSMILGIDSMRQAFICGEGDLSELLSGVF